MTHKAQGESESQPLSQPATELQKNINLLEINWHRAMEAERSAESMLNKMPDMNPNSIREGMIAHWECLRDYRRNLKSLLDTAMSEMWQLEKAEQAKASIPLVFIADRKVVGLTEADALAHSQKEAEQRRKEWKAEVNRMKKQPKHIQSLSKQLGKLWG